MRFACIALLILAAMGHVSADDAAGQLRRLVGAARSESHDVRERALAALSDHLEWASRRGEVRRARLDLYLREVLPVLLSSLPSTSAAASKSRVPVAIHRLMNVAGFGAYAHDQGYSLSEVNVDRITCALRAGQDEVVEVLALARDLSQGAVEATRAVIVDTHSAFSDKAVHVLASRGAELQGVVVSIVLGPNVMHRSMIADALGEHSLASGHVATLLRCALGERPEPDRRDALAALRGSATESSKWLSRVTPLLGKGTPHTLQAGAALLIGRGGKRMQAQVRRLFDLLHGPAEVEAMMAISTIGVGVEWLGRLEQVVMNHSKARVRQYALESIGRIGPAAANALPLVRERAMHSDDGFERAAAVAAAKQLGS